MGTLYVVGTPIGNLEDLTFRALRALREVDLIAAEDTRKTMRLLSHYDIHTPLQSYHQHSSRARLEWLLARLETQNVALVSEAGMPGISDPGQQLIADAVAKGIPVVPVPGPTAVATALAASGFPSDRFLFMGFLPRVSSDRKKLLISVADLTLTLVLYEAPHRLLKCLDDLETVLGNRAAVAGREMTKKHEELVRGRLSELRGVFQGRAPRGEFTLVIGPPEKGGAPEAGARERLPRLAAELRLRGISGKDAVRSLMEATGVGRREAYEAWLDMLQSAEDVG